jgi:hypothetical protein
MNKIVDPNTKHYFQISKAHDLAEKLHFKKSKDRQLTLWEKGEEEKDAEKFAIVEFDAENKILKLTSITSLLSMFKGSPKIGKNILVKIPIDSKTNYFTGGLLSFHKEDSSYSIQIQQEIFISQQRSNFRLNANSVIQIQFKLAHQVYDALDISVGGTSIKINKSDLSQFVKGDIHNECALRFDRKNYYIPKAKISGILPILDEKGHETSELKIGISFIDLNERIADELHVKISVESRGEEMQKKFDEIFEKSKP